MYAIPFYDDQPKLHEKNVQAFESNRIFHREVLQK